MKKNDIVETSVFDITDEGLGVGKADGMTLFIKDAAIGDRLRAVITKPCKNYAFAAIREISEESPDRITPDCPVFKRCGGCSLRHITYDAELRFKQNKVYETVKRIGKVDIKPMPIMSASPLCYRNKAQYPVCESGVGFYAPRSHRVTVTESCLISPPEFSAAANLFRQFLREKNISVYNEQTKKGLVRHFYIRKGTVSGEIQAVAVINGGKLPFEEELAERLKALLGSGFCSFIINENRKDTNVILGDKCRTVWGSDRITDTLCGVKVRLSPFSFYQVNHEMAEKIYKKAAEYANPAGKTVLDLYCGAGTIGLSMASAAREIIGVEIIPEAVEDARFNAEENGIKNARFICGKADSAAELLYREHISPDVVIMDPPRKGCTEELLKTVANGFCPERIVYVSCNAATLARDIEILSHLGYTLSEYTPADLFPRTTHVETVALIIKQ